ncbi:hypothetical protein, variant 5 [Verruconis gallopava]|uniref:Uncharacterized protein n=1 Tax=Verruconis gallopava TaxID=253628 RepID=A0A0D2AQP8_9PEZI|nr:hypothetical protein, variant 3 [Verruconis gallopava]XP_016218852.1 hypothetical protein, variant 4 [Verruconis gallopava]XP_016218853.1 hypothetical protein, variant 5 [Verruconis gallopava]KIW08982.1 hypothetical protein, variant 3 [Verruconis gallopava]KIW08983.1 hypothetical protein, variant 4 [Verruconis gallopava]KIW08984.1 hypothetical protein, variant 5 [Verruconis gallopava]
MVLDLLGLAIGIPAAAGVSTGVAVATSEAVRQQEKEDRDEQLRMRDFHLDVYCDARSRKREQVDGSIVVLKENKLWLAPKDPKTKKPLPMQGEARPCHPFTGFFLDFVGERPKVDPMFERLNKPVKIRGLVSTISQDPPTLNWIYVDRKTGGLLLQVQVTYNRTGPDSSRTCPDKSVRSNSALALTMERWN